MGTIKIKPFTVRKPEKKPDVRKVIDPIIKKEFDSKADAIAQPRGNSGFVHMLNGYRWKVEYYNRVTTSNSGNDRFDINATATDVSYTRIMDTELILESALEGNINELNGSAIISNELVPGIGDAFIGKLGDGKDIVFSVTNMEKLNYRDDNVYKIDFEYYIPLDDNVSEKMSSLAKETLYNFDIGNKTILATAKDKSDLEVLLGATTKMTNIYRTILSRRMNNQMVFQIDNARYTIPMFNYFVKRVMSTDAVNGVIEEMVTLEPLFDNILSYLMTNTKPIKELVKEVSLRVPYDKLGFVDTITFADIDYTIDTVHDNGNMTGTIVETSHTHLPKLEIGDFLIRVDGESLLEKCVIDGLESKTNMSEVVELYKGLDTWNDMEIFFYLPFLYYLVNKVIYEIGE